MNAYTLSNQHVVIVGGSSGIVTSQRSLGFVPVQQGCYVPGYSV